MNILFNRHVLKTAAGLYFGLVTNYIFFSLLAIATPQVLLVGTVSTIVVAPILLAVLAAVRLRNNSNEPFYTIMIIGVGVFMAETLWRLVQ